WVFCPAICANAPDGIISGDTPSYQSHRSCQFISDGSKLVFTITGQFFRNVTLVGSDVSLVTTFPQCSPKNKSAPLSPPLNIPVSHATSSLSAWFRTSPSKTTTSVLFFPSRPATLTS